ncbi:hypothetical protein AAVH_05616 [Aphelenchoides avenae]|nr:hypothetical protein AAVH_05616 [Aphelenchus avenae]
MVRIIQIPRTLKDIKKPDPFRMDLHTSSASTIQMSSRGTDVETECTCGTAALELGEIPVGTAVDRGAGKRTQQEHRCQRMLSNLADVIRAHPRVHSYKVSMETGYAVGEQPRPQQTYEEYRSIDPSLDERGGWVIRQPDNANKQNPAGSSTPTNRGN